mmetsp:Transcript_13011/g.25526  ORF Transcript_13011/g.25526 Transcript_13011/m.25526 type:complete len:111 (+) Transcript_13011:169-501(+)
MRRLAAPIYSWNTALCCKSGDKRQKAHTTFGCAILGSLPAAFYQAAASMKACALKQLGVVMAWAFRRCSVRALASSSPFPSAAAAASSARRTAVCFALRSRWQLSCSFWR